MLVFERKIDLILHLQSTSNAPFSVGFVPTMGALHAGHLSLLQQSLRENSITVISIFVNPTQFNNPEDLIKYPRTLEKDLEKIKTISEKIIIYAPTVEDIYEGKTISKTFDFDGLENQMEGKFRPGHFDGVGTIVKKLFEIIKPTNAYFGEKDFQQLQIVKKMVQKEKLFVNVVGCPIFREPNGLAMSSRNERLSPLERDQAKIIFETLTRVKEQFENKTVKQVSNFVTKVFENIDDFNLEYFVIADETTLIPCIRKIKNKKYRAFIAVFINKIRLIDTISLN